MRRPSTPACIVILLAALPACSTAPKNTVYAHGPDDDIRQQIGRNWVVDSGALADCREPVDLRIQLAPDGSGKVTDVEILPGLPATDACRRLGESARRAALIASPLKLPADSKLSSLRLHFSADYAME